MEGFKKRGEAVLSAPSERHVRREEDRLPVAKGAQAGSERGKSDQRLAKLAVESHSSRKETVGKKARSGRGGEKEVGKKPAHSAGNDIGGSALSCSEKKKEDPEPEEEDILSRKKRKREISALRGGLSRCATAQKGVSLQCPGERRGRKYSVKKKVDAVLEGGPRGSRDQQRICLWLEKEKINLREKRVVSGRGG